jgi:predicted metalloprotease with PDZ domain
MNYRLEEVGQIVGPAATPFLGEQQVVLALNGGLSQLALNRTSVAANETLDIARTQTGTLTTSLFLNQGDVARLSIQTNSTAIASIPLPDTFFAFAFGLAILIILNEKLSLVRLNQPPHIL